MDYKMFYEKCTLDTAYFFDIYFGFMKKINSPEFIRSTPPIKTKNGLYISSQYHDMFYFLWLFLYVTSDIGKKFIENGVNLLMYYNVHENIFIEKDACICEVDSNPSDRISKREEDNYLSKWLLKNCIDWSRERITLERILYNFIKMLDISDSYNLKEAFKITDEFTKNILAEAELKETGKLKTVIMDDPTSFEAILDKLRAGKLPTQAMRKVEDGTQSAKKPEEDSKQKDFPFGIELTKQEFKYNPLVGREKDLRLLGALLLDEEKSVIIHGKPGVGKSTLVEGLAYNIQNGLAHQRLLNSRIFQISATEIVEGTFFRGKLEKKINDIIESLMAIENSILFIDEFHMLVGCGASTEDHNDVSNMLKPFVGNGKIKLIGATTFEEYSKILSNGAFARRFNGMPLNELTTEEIIKILYSLIIRMEKNKNIKFAYPEEIKNEILKLIISLSDRKYMALDQRYNPDFALTILRNGYNFADYDGKNELDVSSLIEGVSIIDTINQEGKEYFKENVLSLSRHKNH